MLGDLTYQYDASGRRVRVGGSFARTGIPQPVSSASYNAANHQVSFGSQTLTYDLNGNLTSDGVNTYTWNARDQLVGISGSGLNASFQYDAVGRRLSRTINGTTASFQHDGLNVVTETNGTSTANILTGRLDETFARTDPSGTWGLIKDGLGSSVALTDTSGVVQTELTYEPFGSTTSSGLTNENTNKFTGREDDGTGLYYYRARYYSPTFQRFIAEDPLELGGGDVNLYLYVANAPSMFTDPLGLKPRRNVPGGATRYLSGGGRLPSPPGQRRSGFGPGGPLPSPADREGANEPSSSPTGRGLSDYVSSAWHFWAEWFTGARASGLGASAQAAQGNNVRATVSRGSRATGGGVGATAKAGVDMVEGGVALAEGLHGVIEDWRNKASAVNPKWRFSKAIRPKPGTYDFSHPPPDPPDVP